MGLVEHFQLMADYNRWMNEKVYQAASTLTAECLAEDRGAYFSSILGTLNHILVGDVLWLKRFAEHPSAPSALQPLKLVEKPTGLDAVLHTDFGALRLARVEMDELLVAFCDELSEDVLASPLDYKNSKGILFRRQFSFLIQHLFNHQTHHRGQLTTLLNQLGIDCGVTDLLMRIPEFD